MVYSGSSVSNHLVGQAVLDHVDARHKSILPANVWGNGDPVGVNGILASHLNFGDPRRGWDFRSLGRGGVDFEEIIRALNDAGYRGPLSVEWEDSGMDRRQGAYVAGAAAGFRPP